MRIVLDNVSKRFNQERIFKNFTYEFKSGHSYALVGPNGSGKSTMMQVIAGYSLPSEGTIDYFSNEKLLEKESYYEYLSLATPYMELVEEFTLQEQVEFHLKFKRSEMSAEQIIDKAYLNDSKHKAIKNFSSGMKQRLKLALAFFSNVEVILLDEPTSNLDKEGIAWYHEQISLMSNRLLIIASNQQYEFDFCKQQINLMDLK